MTSTPHELGVTVGAWNALVRRARMGRERKVACLVVSSYAQANGTGIHCGVARLAVDLEVSHRTARRYLAWLRDVGLIQLVRAGNRRRGRSDEYRLILGPNILEDLDVPDPDRYRAMCDDTHDARNGAAAATHQGTPMVSPENRDQGTNPGRSGDTQDVPPSPIYISQERSISQADDEDLRTDVAVGGPGHEEPTKPGPRGRPTKCPDGLSAAMRPDGKPECPICRRRQSRPGIEIPPPPEERLATVTPIDSRRIS